MDKTPRTTPVRRHLDIIAVGVLTIVSFAMNTLPRDLGTLVLIALSFLVLPFQRVTHAFRLAVWPLLVILLLGVTGLQNHAFRDIARDFFFALTPVAMVFLGFWLAERKGFWDQLPVVLVWLGVIFALKHLYAFAVTPSLLLAESMVVRAAVGTVSDITVLGFLVLLFINRFTPGRKPLQGFAYGLAFSILLASVVLGYSRTAVAVLVLGFMGAKGWLTGRNLKWYLLIICTSLVYLLSAGGGEYSGEELNFLSKMARSLTEIAVSDYNNFADISVNWRGFETLKTWEQYVSGTSIQWIFGQGYGALADLGFYMALGGDGSIDFRYIPVMHNGYAYILLKYGIVGIILYITFFVNLIYIAAINQNSPSPLTAFCARLLLGLIIVMIFIMIFSAGIAQLASSEYLVLSAVLVRKITSLRPKSTAITRH